MRLQHLAVLLAATLFSIASTSPISARTIAWPDGCDYTAHDPRVTPLPDLCAAAIDALDWAKLPKRKNGWPRCDPDLSGGFRDENGWPRMLWPDGGRSHVRLVPLGGERFLMEIRCDTALYNVVNIYVLYDESRRPVRAEFLWFRGYRMENETAVEEVTPYVWARSFNPKTRELVALAKYRGMGDCGEFSRYVLRGDEFVLTEFRAKVLCDGSQIYQLRGTRKYDVRPGVAQPSPSWQRYFPPQP